MQIVENKEDFINHNTEIFTGIGEFPEKISIKLKENAVPKACPPRRMPCKVINSLKQV